jgi:hypothetical protein|tara:strand:- start:413 stop:1000 length:588 start_codon:yes stop_codon:yes gene_type:complete
MKNLKKHLLEIEEKREKRIVESSIINRRLKSSKTLPKLVSEIKYMRTQKFDTKLINENLISVLNQMFQDDGPQFMDTVKSKLSEFLMSKLNIGDFEQKVIEKAIGETDIDDVTKLFTEPRFLASKLAKVYSEDFSTGYLETLPEFMKSKVAKLAQDPNNEKELEDMFVDMLNPLMGDINSKMERKMMDIRDNIVS